MYSYLPLLLVLIIVAYFIRQKFRLFFDDSDNKELGKDSGLIVYTDYGTGNQYISTIFDFTGHKPRLDHEGKQVNIYTNPLKNKEDLLKKGNEHSNS